MQTVSDNAIIREMDADELEYIWIRHWLKWYNLPKDNPDATWFGAEICERIRENYRQQTGKELPII